MTEKTGHFTEDEEDKNVVDRLNNKLILEIYDNGKGFPTNEIAHIFEKFYRLKNTQTGGTGLGLFIAKGFVEAQGGSNSVHNQRDGGAKFIIEIPTLTLTQNIHNE